MSESDESFEMRMNLRDKISGGMMGRSDQVIEEEGEHDDLATPSLRLGSHKVEPLVENVDADTVSAGSLRNPPLLNLTGAESGQDSESCANLDLSQADLSNRSDKVHINMKTINHNDS